MPVSGMPDRNTKAVWATAAASWLVVKLATLACFQWMAVCDFLTPDVTAAIAGLLAGVVSHLVPQSTQEILNLAAQVKVEAPDSPTPSR